MFNILDNRSARVVADDRGYCDRGETDSRHRTKSSIVPLNQELCKQRAEEVVNYLNAILAPVSLVEEQLAQQCRRGGNSQCSGASGVRDVVDIAVHLRKLGYQVTVRKVLSVRDYWTKTMMNMFVVCNLNDGLSGYEYIVEPNFKELFRIGHMTDTYKLIWESLPSVLVCQCSQLVPVISLLCEEVETSFSETGHAVPPWRLQGPTLNRWLSEFYSDLDVPAEDSGPHHAAFLRQCVQLSCLSPALISRAATRSSSPRGCGSSASFSSVGSIQGGSDAMDSGSGSGTLSGSNCSTRTNSPLPPFCHLQLSVCATVLEPLHRQVNFQVLSQSGDNDLFAEEVHHDACNTSRLAQDSSVPPTAANSNNNLSQDRKTQKSRLATSLLSTNLNSLKRLPWSNILGCHPTLSLVRNS